MYDSCDNYVTSWKGTSYFYYMFMLKPYWVGNFSLRRSSSFHFQTQVLVLIRVWKLCERSVKNVMSNCQFQFLTESFCFDVPLLLLCFTSLVSFQCDWYRKNKWMNQYKFLVLSLSYYTLIFSFSWNFKWPFKHECGHVCAHATIDVRAHKNMLSKMVGE